MSPWNDTGTVLGTEHELMAELAELSSDHAPRRFSLCLVDREEDDAVVVGWGMAFADEAVAYLPGDVESGRRDTFMRVASAERARHRLARHDADVRLIWLDPAST
jgi:hypothetical protein